MMNDVQPELRSGSVSPVAYDDDRVGIHAMLYPQPFGIQAEWNWGRGPEYARASQSILPKTLHGGHVQLMYRDPMGSVGALTRSDEHTPQPQPLIRTPYAALCYKIQ